MHDINRVITVTLNPTIDRVIEVPDFHVGGHLCGRGISRVPAGKAINVSCAMSALDVPSTAVGFIGRTTLDAFEDFLKPKHIKTDFTPIAADTRENITLTDPETHAETHIRDAGPTVTAHEVDALQATLTRYAHPGNAIAFNGSTAPGLSTQRFGELIQICIDGGASVVIDTSGDALIEAARHPLWLLKPNRLELSQLVGCELHSDDDILNAGRSLAQRIPIVIVTLGERGAHCFSSARVWHSIAKVPAERIRSTVGCGDAMLAGFLAGIVKGMELEAALNQGVAIAAASAMNDQPARFDITAFSDLCHNTRSTCLS